MVHPAIRVEHLSKSYRVVHAASRNDTFTDVFTDLIRRPFRKRAEGSDAAEVDETFWALRDVSFDVQPGEVIGIIGRNGAGKSTLLKILSRITAPTEGRVEIRGRVASLLEVGTGFHPELTGRENVYMNGSILGMKRAEIEQKFDAIVDFAGVERFLDTPLKRYSSGMYVRLAFAVAAHLDPEILIVDEVLAVGDAEFQRKCLGQMAQVSQRGRTVLFVSHNLAAVRTLCSTALLLEAGRASLRGPVEEVVSRYLNQVSSLSEQALAERTDRLGNGLLRFTAVRVLGRDGRPIEELPSGDALTIEADYSTSGSIDHTRLFVGMSFFDAYQSPMALFASDEMGATFGPVGRSGTLRLEIPQLLLRAGSYSLKLMASHGEPTPEQFYDVIEDAVGLSVLPGDFWRSGYTNRAGGYCVIPAAFHAAPSTAAKAP